MKLLARLVRTAPLVHPEPGMRDRVWRLKYCLRGLAFSSATRKWFRLLEDDRLAVVSRNHPHIFSKLQRVYLDRNLGVAERMARLQSHYRFVSGEFTDEMVGAIYGTSGYALASIALEAVGDFGLRLLYFDSLEKEGELSLAFHDENSGRPLFALSFCVTQFDARRRELLVGGLQGFRSENEKDRIVAITRAMHGLRPKALLVIALQAFAGRWQFQSIRAVSDDRHVYQHFLRRKTLAASYDEFWLECGGQVAPDGLFDLPAVFAPRDLSSLKPGKRPMYRRRYLMLEQITADVQASLVRSTPPAHLNGDAPECPPAPGRAIPFHAVFGRIRAGSAPGPLTESKLRG